MTPKPLPDQPNKTVEPLELLDTAEEMRRVIEAYNSGWSMVRGHTTVNIEAFERWTEAVERAAVAIHGPADGLAASDEEQAGD